jgi:hypothetical protein
MERGIQRHVLADAPRRERTTSSGIRVRIFLYTHPALEQVVALRGLLRDRRQLLGQ